MSDPDADRTPEHAEGGPPAGALVRVASVRDLTDERRRVVTTTGEHEILTLAVRGEIYAVANICTHGTIWLDIGDVDAESREIQCPFHAGRFSLVTGAATKAPCRIPLRTYEVVVRGAEVFVRVPRASDEPPE
jgi:nitrite reductase/ring-hydroxylating ferredoxin subunit